MTVWEETYNPVDEERVEEALRLSRRLQKEAERLNTLFAALRPVSRLTGRREKNGTNGQTFDPTGIARQIAEVDLLLKQLSAWEDSRLVPRDARQTLRERYLDAESIYLKAEKRFGLDPLYAAYVAYIKYCLREYGYLDSQGIMQMEHAVTLPLEDVYVSLQAERESETLSVWRNRKQDETMDQYHERLLAERERPTLPLPLDQVARTHQRVVLLGDPGAGKTTLLRFLAQQFANAHSHGQAEVSDKDGRNYGATRLPIYFRVAAFVEAREHSGGTFSVRDFLPAAFSSLASHTVGLSRLLGESLDNGRALVLIDGLDEIASGSSRKQTLEAIELFLREHPKNRFLITSRVAGYREMPLVGWVAEATYALRDMDETQVEQFLVNWCCAVERFQRTRVSESQIEARADAEKAKLMQAYRSNEGVRRLAKNPLLLTILALIQNTHTTLPKDRGELYKIAVGTLLNNWTQRKGLDGETIEPALAEAFLGPLALMMHTCSSTGLIAEKQALAALCRVEAERQRLPENDPRVMVASENFLRKVRLRSGILTERVPGYYGFLHLTFEEYYAGLELVSDSDVAVTKIRAIRRLPRWKEPIRLAVAKQSLRQATLLIENAILWEAMEPVQRDLDRLLLRNFLLACHCTADNNSKVPGLAAALFQRAAETYLTPGYSDAVKAELLDCLAAFSAVGRREEETSGNLGSASDAVIVILITALKDENWSTRQSAAQVLGQLGIASAEVIAALLAALKDEASWVRQGTAQALGQLGSASEAVIAALLDALKNGDEDVRLGAAQALGQLSSASAEVLAALLATLRDKSEKWAVRQRTAQALGQLGIASAEVIAALLTALRDKVEDWSIRHEAAQALGQLGSASVEVIAALLATLRDKSEKWAVRQRTAQALGQLGIASAEVIAALLTALRDKVEDWSVRQEATQALGQLGSASAEVIAALLTALKDENWSVRRYAAQALGQLGIASAEVIAALLTALTNGDEDVRLGAVQAMGELGTASAEVIAALITALTNRDEASWVRQEATQALGQLGSASAEVIAALLTALKDENWSVRRYAAQALGQLGSASDAVITALLAALKDETWDVRQSAAQALDRLTQVSTHAADLLGITCG